MTLLYLYKPIFVFQTGDGRIADTVPNLRTVFSNGTIIFFPFAADLHRSEIHSRDYRCRARNTVGQIISRITNVKAGTSQIFKKI